MLLNIIKQFNWADILLIIVFYRICYIGVVNGLPSEIFKLLGIILANYVSFHYYTVFSDFISSHIDLRKVPLEFLDFLCFVIMILVAHVIFMVLRGLFARAIKLEAVPRLNKWGGLILSLVRGYLLAGLICYAMAISSIAFLKDSVKHSYIGVRMFTASPDTYTWLWKNVASKFMVREKFNETILEVQEKF